MSQNNSKEPKSAEISVVLSNFRGLQYDIDEDTEYEVIASHVNKILSNDRFQINHKSLPEIFIKISIDTSDEHEISNLFLNPLLLTLTKHEIEKSDTVGYCNIDLSPLCSTKCEAIECYKLFSSEKMARKISLDVNTYTNIPLMDIKYVNCLFLTLDSLCNFETGSCKDHDILIALNAPNETFKSTAYKVNSHELKLYKQSTDDALITCNYSETHSSINLKNELNQLCGHQHICMDINANLKYMIPSSEACLSFHDHIRKFDNISIEILIDNREHLFGLIDCAELLNVGQRKIRALVPLYKYDDEIFKGCSQCSSIFYKPELNLNAKSNRISRKTQNIQHRSINSLEDIKAINSEGNQIAAVVQIELEKALNEEVLNGSLKVSQNVQSISHFSKNNSIKELREMLLLDVEKFNPLSNHNMMKGCTEIKNSIFPKLKVLRDHFQGSFDDDEFECYLTSEIVNIKKKSSNNFILAEIYKSIDMTDKAEEILLHDIQNNRNSEAAWLNFAIFNAKQEEFDKMKVSVDELLKINPQSLISNILKAYILFKSHKHTESLNYMCQLTKTFGEIEELSIMRYVIKAMLGIENNPFKSSSEKNDEIESIHNRTDLNWLAARDDSLLSWQNLFIKSASFFIKIGCYDIAELCLGEYYQTYGININYLYLLAAIDSSKGNHKAALHHLNRISDCDIVNYNLNYSKIVKSITLNLLHTKSFKKAAEIFNTYIQTESCDKFLILFLLGLYFNRTNEFVIAKEFLIQAVKIFHCHVAFQELGKCFLGLNMLELAEKAFLSALQFEINNNDTMISLREIYKNQGRYEAIDFCDYNIQSNNNINNAH